MLACRGIRGATIADANTDTAIYAATYGGERRPVTTRELGGSHGNRRCCSS